MSTVSLGLASIADDGGWTTVGGGTILGNIVDGSDSTGVTPPTGDDPQGTLIAVVAMPTLPAYGRVTGLNVTARWQGSGGQVSVLVYQTGPTGFPLAYQEVPAGIATRAFPPLVTAPSGAPWTAADLGQVTVHVWGTGTVTLWRLQASVTVDEAPVVRILSPVGDLSADLPIVARWSSNDPEKQQPERTQVRLYRASQLSQGFSPGSASVVPAGSWDLVGPGTTLPLGPLPPNAYQLYIRVSEVGSGGRYGGWATASFELTGAAAGTPQLAVTPQPHLQRARIVVTRRDNLLTWEQAGGGDGTTPNGWYADANCLPPGTAAPVASGTEGGTVITATSVAAGEVAMRSGGPWSTGVVPPLSGRVVQDVANTPPRASTSTYGSGPVTTAARTFTAGTVLVASASAGSTTAGGSVGPSLSSSPALSWTLLGSTGATSSKDEALAWVATVASTGSYTVTLTASDNAYAKTLAVVPYLGVDTASPVSSSGTGASRPAPSVTGTATAAGAVLAVSFAEYYDRAVPSIAPGTFISGARVGTVGAYAVSPPAGASGATLTVGVTAPTSSTSWTWVWLVLRPAATPPPIVVDQAGDLAGFAIEPLKAYVAVGALWQSANAARHGRLDMRCYSAAGVLLSTTAGSVGATSTGTAMADLPSVPFTAPAGSAVGLLVPVMTDAAAGGEVAHWDRLGVGPAGWKWSRGGTVRPNLLGPKESGLFGGDRGTWGSLGASVNAIAASTLSGYALRVNNASAGSVSAGPSPVPIPRGAKTLSAGCLMSVTDASITGCWTALRFIGADGATLQWPGGPLTNPPVAGRTPAVFEAVPVPAGAVSVQIGVKTFSGVSAAQGLDCSRFGIWAGDTVPAGWQPGPPTRAFPLAEYSDDAETWNIVFDTDAVDYGPDGTVELYDYEICPGVQRLYRASTRIVDYRSDPSGVPSVSAPSASLPAWIPAKDWWLSDPQKPGSTIPIQVGGSVDFTIVAHSAQHDVLSDPGRPDDVVLPVFTFDGRGGFNQQLPILMRGHDGWRQFRRLIQSGATLLLASDMEEQWYVQLADVAGTLRSSTSRLVDPTRPLTVTVVEVERPPVVVS